jgi:hypothetical protein
VKQSALIIGMLILAGATLLGGVIQGRMCRRWGRPQEFQKLAERLRELPTTIGDWTMKASEPLARNAEAELECAGYVIRQYQNRKTGDIVTAALLLGPAGPISVHTPDICYSSQQYTVIESATKIPMVAGKGAQDELLRTSLESTNLSSGNLSVFYGWSTGGPWTAPKDARFTFAGRPYLYKIQVAGPLPLPGADKASEPCRLFLNEFLPAVRPYLVAPEKE